MTLEQIVYMKGYEWIDFKLSPESSRRLSEIDFVGGKIKIVFDQQVIHTIKILNVTSSENWRPGEAIHASPTGELYLDPCLDLPFPGSKKDELLRYLESKNKGSR